MCGWTCMLQEHDTHRQAEPLPISGRKMMSTFSSDTAPLPPGGVSVAPSTGQTSTLHLIQMHNFWLGSVSLLVPGPSRGWSDSSNMTHQHVPFPGLRRLSAQSQDRGGESRARQNDLQQTTGVNVSEQSETDFVVTLSHQRCGDPTFFSVFKKILWKRFEFL